MKPWFKVKGDPPSDGRWIMWTQCPECYVSAPVVYKRYIAEKHDELGLELDLYYCFNCTTVFNMNRDLPPLEVWYVTEEYSAAHGFAIREKKQRQKKR